MNTIPSDKIGYTFSLKCTNTVNPINSAIFTVTKFATSEAEALSETIEDTERFMTYLKDRQNIVGKLIPSPFVAIENK
jgi:hypothetical protein